MQYMYIMYINALFLLLYINFRYTKILSVQIWKFMSFPLMDLRQNFILDSLVALKQLPTFWNRSHVEKSWIIF
jgi:hypothetical protein